MRSDTPATSEKKSFFSRASKSAAKSDERGSTATFNVNDRRDDGSGRLEDGPSNDGRSDGDQSVAKAASEGVVDSMVASYPLATTTEVGENVTLIHTRTVQFCHEIDMGDGATWSDVKEFSHQWSVDANQPLMAVVTRTRSMGSQGRSLVVKETRDPSGRLISTETDASGAGEDEEAFDRDWLALWKPRLDLDLLKEYEHNTMVAVRRNRSWRQQ